MRVLLLTAGLLLGPGGGLAAQDAALGGRASVQDEGVNAFGHPAPGLARLERRAFSVGNAFFRHNWVVAPASAAGRDGLGPLFNERSCSGCHLRDGRSRPPEAPEDPTSGLLLRVGIRGEHGDLPHPVYGGQLQDHAVPGFRPEARVVLEREPVRGAYADGTPYTLERLRPRLEAFGFGDPGEDLRLGARVAPQLIGLGLLEAIPTATLERLSDPEDHDGDGISGRIHWLTSNEGVRQPGRFGWKATQPTVRAQTAAAFVNDIGITSPLFPDEVLTSSQRSAAPWVSGGDPEIDARKLDRVSFYCQTLAVPHQRTPEDPQVQRGAALFRAIGCVACHQPAVTTADDAAISVLAGQRIRPYTDLLLHDLGPGLADEKHDGDALPSEWRTPPLWGLGLLPAVNGHQRLLHDGRADGFAAAILWHGGEAQAAREAFRHLDAAARAALLAFISSL